MLIMGMVNTITVDMSLKTLHPVLVFMIMYHLITVSMGVVMILL
jgi:hypothetical protein